jgi:hypothetical protein
MNGAGIHNPGKPIYHELDTSVGANQKATTNTGAWVDWSLAAIVTPNSMVGVACKNASGAGAQLGVRTKGSALSRVIDLGNTVVVYMEVKASAAGVIQYWDSANGSTYFLVGYSD